MRRKRIYGADKIPGEYNKEHGSASNLQMSDSTALNRHCNANESDSIGTDQECSVNKQDSIAIDQECSANEQQKDNLISENDPQGLRKEYMHCQQLESEVEMLKKELDDSKLSCQKLKSKLHELQNGPTVSKEELQADDKMVTYYTGLPNFSTLILVFELVLKVISVSKEHGNRKLTNFDESFLTMMKLRLTLQ